VKLANAFLNSPEHQCKIEAYDFGIIILHTFFLYVQ